MKKSREKMKKDGGITLIALVITVIVLLILAGVSIAMLTGNNSILNEAGVAKEETTKSAAKEKLGIILTELQLEHYAEGTDLELNSELAATIAQEDDVESAVYSEGIIKVVIDGYEFNVNNLLSITEAGVLTADINVEVIDTVCIRLSSANPEAYANLTANGEGVEIASTTGIDGLNIASTSGSASSIITIVTPDGVTETLDLADETAYVEYWAYKSKTYTFYLSDGENADTLEVEIDIPYTDSEYITVTSGKFALKDFSSYYIAGGTAATLKNENYPISIINMSNDLGITSLSEFAFCVNGITTIIYPETLTSLTGGIYTTGIKTIYVPSSVTSIAKSAFSGLSSDAVIHFEASEEQDTWTSGWDYGCSATILYNQ